MALLGWAGHLLAVWLLGLTLGWLVSFLVANAFLQFPEAEAPRPF